MTVTTNDDYSVENEPQRTLYDAHFEALFLDASRLFYREESLCLVEQLVPNDYLIKVILSK
jgi:hypothetical protein